VDDAPPQRPEQPLAEEQEATDDEQDPGEQQDGERDAGQGRGARDLAADLRDLRATELDVRGDEPFGRGEGRAGLLANARRTGARRPAVVRFGAG